MVGVHSYVQCLNLVTAPIPASPILEALQVTPKPWQSLCFTWWSPSSLWSEHHKHKVYKELLKTVPNLKEQIMMGSEEVVTEITHLVSVISILCYTDTAILCCSSFTKGWVVPEVMTPKPSGATFWNGSHQTVKSSILPFTKLQWHTYHTM